MKDEVKECITGIKADLTGWPKEHRASFVNGIVQGLTLGILAAEQKRCNIAEIEAVEEFSTFIIQNTGPVKKRRNEASQMPKAARDQLVDDIKELLRRAIACRLKIPKDTFDKSLPAVSEFVTSR